jgi:diguanylate cyclase (GGDEF)-like protein
LLMKQEFEALRKLAKLAVEAPETREGLTRVADTLREALDVAGVYFAYAPDKALAVCGDCRSGDDIGTSQIGLWLVQRQAVAHKGPVAFNIRNRRVEDFTSALGAEGRAYVALRVPTSRSPAEMLILRGCWERRIPEDALCFLETATPSLTIFLERILNAARGSFQREHMVPLTNAAEVLTQSEDTESVLRGLASAIAHSTGYRMASVNLWDEASQKLTPRILNVARWGGSLASREWDKMLESVPDLPALESARTRQPVLSTDVQNDEREHEASRRFWQSTMIISMARFPIIFGDEVLGTMGLASWQPCTFPPEEVEFLKKVAAQVAVALKAMQMYEALAQSEEQLREYSKKLQARMEIQHLMARTDALTGIPNRRYVEEVIEGECGRAEREGRSLSIAMVDADGLKEVNDRYGHSGGDEVLVRLGQIARRSCRRGDVVGRYGGDEFLFVLPEAALGAARRFAERFRRKVEREGFCLTGGGRAETSVSLGIAEYDRGRGEKASDLIGRADRALYEAKSQGGNVTCPVIAAKRAA